MPTAARPSDSPKSRCPMLLAGGLAALLAIAWGLTGGSAAEAAGLLGMVREDVRADPPAADYDPRPRSHCHGDCDDSDDSSLLGDFLGAMLTGMFSSSSRSGQPPASVETVSFDSYFPRHPYDRVPGYMVSEDWPATILLASAEGGSLTPQSDCLDYDPSLERMRPWAGRVRVDYFDNFDDLSRIGGHLLFSTTSRLGLDMQMDYLQENLAHGGHDSLWLGDCNLIYRFAEGPGAQWRLGAGFGWLDDEINTNYGFNFTCGADFYLAKPWIISAELDWGKLGRAELFRFRTTAGVIVWGIESYVGYEYLDIDRSQVGGLIAGVRLWF